MAYDPFAGHASPVNGGTSPWTLAGLGGMDDGGGRHAPADPIGPGPGGHGLNGGPDTNPTPPTDPAVYGGGFGSLDRDFSLADFHTDPGYQWRMDQGIQALDRSASARGQLFSGGELKALDRYNQGFASNEYQNAFSRYTQNQGNRFNRLAALSGIGQAAQNQMTGYAQNLGPSLAQGYYGIGNAQAAGAYGQANAINNGLNGLGSAWNWYSMNKPASGSPSPGAPDWTSGTTTFDPWGGGGLTTATPGR